jgi:hypothetical protein
MNSQTRLLAGIGAAGLLVTMVAPAQAGTKWGGPQEASSKLGRAIGVSEDGRVAAWIRTNKSDGSGPVRTSWYQSTKKGWVPSAPIPGTAMITDLQVSSDGNFAFAESPGTGYLLAQRSTKNTWGAAQTVVSGAQLAYGQTSADAGTIVWVDWTGARSYPAPEVPGVVKAQTRKPDGTWNTPVEIGKINYDFYYGYDDADPIVLSSDGSTLAWFDETYALKISTKQADGTWGTPALVKQFADDPGITALRLSANGGTFVWSQAGTEGVLVTSRTATGWTPLGYVTTDDVTRVQISPDGLTVAYGTEANQMVVRRWDGALWGKAVVVGSASTPDIELKNTTLAWASSVYSGSTVRVSIYKKGKWQPTTKVTSAGQGPTLNTSGTTLIWGSTANKRVYSVKR